MTLYLPNFTSASQPMKGEIIIKADPKSNITSVTQTEELYMHGMQTEFAKKEQQN